MVRKKLHNHGPWFQQRRHAVKLTQAKLAEMVDKDPSYIAKIESGDRWPSLPSLYRILEALQVDPEEAIRTLHLVDNDEVDRVLRFIEFLEDIERAVPKQKLNEFRSFFTDQDVLYMAGSLAAREPLPPGPEGWHQLTSEDRRLVQRVVNRILAGYPTPSDNALPSPAEG